MDKYKGLISIMCNKIDIIEVLSELRLFVGGTAISLCTKSSSIYTDGDYDNMTTVSVLNRMRYDLAFDVDYTKFNIQPFIQVIEGVLGVDAEADEFLVTMSHEIRNPLHGVTGYSQLLQNTDLDKEQKGLLKSLTNCSLQLMQIINDVLDVSRLNSGRMQIQEECFLFNNLQEQVTSILSQRIREKRQTLVWRRSSDIPEYIISDKQRIIQILINLISNAHKFSDKGKTIQVVFSVKSAGNLTFQVIDEGEGIPTSELCDIFRPFKQITSNISSGENGSGLGLAICKSLSVLMGGDIHVSSVESVGSVFTVDVKFSEVKDEESTPVIQEFDVSGISILVISDVMDIRMSLVPILDSLNSKTTSIATVEEARYYISKGSCKPDIVFMQDSFGSIYSDKIQHLIPLVPLISIGNCDSLSICNLHGCVDIPICRTQVIERIKNVRVFNIDNDMNDELPKPPSPKRRFKEDARVLICEDSAYNRDILNLMLRRMGFVHIDSVTNGSEAIDLINETDTPYDLLYLDLTMPVVDGYGVIKYIHDRDMDLPKIIVVTASVLQGERDRCMSMGVNYFLKKPYCTETLRVVTYKSLSSIGFEHTRL